MSDIALRVENLGKRYRLGLEQAGRFRYKSLRDSLGGIARDPVKALRSAVVPERMNEANSFWALHDINFQVKRGEAVGIIGRNGAGKSTLLKILSRITKPTVGHAALYGRVGSLLEVGTGFHPELTGRENIYLNGAVLGMTRAEVRSKFDEIVAFSEIEKFLDTSVKHYSSGMYMRLAFAVAAHLETEILVVDEVLAVGDAEFQNKCLGKMKDVAGHGRTVLFVSHNMAAVSQLCQRAVLLDHGQIEFLGDARSAVERYWGRTGADSAEIAVAPTPGNGPSNQLCLTRIRLLNAVQSSFSVRWRESLDIELTLVAQRPLRNVFFGLAVRSVQGVPVLTAQSRDGGGALWHLGPGQQRVRLCVENPFRSGTFALDLGAESPLAREPLFLVHDVVQFRVLDVGVDDIPYPHELFGLVNGSAKWTLEGVGEGVAK